MKFSAVAFDLDGTLYPNFRLFVRLFPFLLKEQRLLRALGKARNILRKSYNSNDSSASLSAEFPDVNLSGEDFYGIQAGIMGKILGQPADKVRERTERLIYRGWEPLFRKIRLFPHVKETLEAFRKGGVKMGLLSDFPPEIKLKNLGIFDCWDVVVCSEQTGRLKPDEKPFLDLAAMMGMPPEKILYVGNSVPYDVEGSRKTGMKAAHIRPGWRKYSSPKEVDFVFYDYRQLRDYVLS